MSEEYIEASLGDTQEDARSEEIVKEVGKIVEEIEKRKIDEEEEEITEYGIVIYKVEADLLEAMLYQAKIYKEVINGRLSVTEAKAKIEKALAPVIARLEQDLKKKEKKKKKTSSKKKSSKTRKTKSKKKKKTS